MYFRNSLALAPGLVCLPPEPKLFAQHCSAAPPDLAGVETLVT